MVSKLTAASSPLQSRRYRNLKPGELPTCESLKDTIARALPFWNEVIAPEIKAGKNVIIAAHGNSLRGIVKHLDGELLLLQNQPTAAWCRVRQPDARREFQ